MKFKPENHIVGKVYDLTQENMNSMLKTIEILEAAVHEAADLLEEDKSFDAEMALVGAIVKIREQKY